MAETPEGLLREAGRPRPLPPQVRARLEGVLLGGQAEARSLPPEVRGRLEGELRPRLGGWERQEDRPKTHKGKNSGKNLGKWWPVAATAGLAAAVAIVAGLLVPGLAHSPRPEARSAAGAFGTAQKSAKTSPSTPSAPASSQANPPGAPVRLAKPAPHAVAGTALQRPLRAVASPVVSSVTPRRGPGRGGNVVTLFGTGLASARAVYFGAVEAPKFRVISPHELQVVAPAHSPGPVYVVVVVAAPAVRSAERPADTYTYTP